MISAESESFLDTYFFLLYLVYMLLGIDTFGLHTYEKGNRQGTW